MNVTPKMSFIEAVKTCLTEKYCKFSGRARRSEYWWYCLATGIISCVAQMVLGNSTAGMIGYLVICLALLLPGWGVSVRRLHDIGKSGWSLLICLIPLVGSIILLVWLAKDSQPGVNQYGESPKYPNA